MESKKINQLATELAPDLTDLTIIGDPITGISKKITLSQMASLFTGTVEEYANKAAFPLVGVADTIYVALDTNVIWRWNTGTSAYVELSPNIINSLVFGDGSGFDGTISLVGSVATLTITTALTTGSVGFIGASGALLEDNANFFWNNSTKRLGINTNAPTTALDVFGSGIIGRINGTSTNNAFLGFASAGTNKWSVGNVQSDHRFRIYSEANSAELISVLQTGEFGIGIANPLTKLHIFGGATALIANLDANVSVAKSISFRSGNSSRINLEVSGIESGSNAGANFFIRRYSDAGALIDTPLTITRSTGTISLTGALSSTFVGKFLDNTGASTLNKIIRISNTGADMAIGIEGSTPSEIIAGSGGIAYSSVFKTVGTTSLILGTNSIAALTINGSTQAATFTGDLTLNGASGSRTLTIQNNTSGDAILALTAAGSDGGAITYKRTTSELILSNSGATNALKIANTGAATFLLGIGIGGAIATTGGIQFPATQISSANPNNLDDYEEGTWTPIITGGGSNPTITYASGNTGGIYTKIGNIVTISFEVRWTALTGGSGAAIVSGLPFTRRNIVQPDGDRTIIDSYNNVINGLYLVGNVQVNSTTIGMSLIRSANTTLDLDVSNLNATFGFLRASITYFV